MTTADPPVADERMKALYAEYRSTHVVAALVGLSSGDVHRRLKAAGVDMTRTDPRAPGKRATVTDDQLQELYAELGSKRAVAARLGVAVTSAERWLAAAGVEMRRRKHPATDEELAEAYRRTGSYRAAADAMTPPMKHSTAHYRLRRMGLLGPGA